MKLEILQYPDSRLRKNAEVVPHIDEDLRQLVGDMADTMYHARGVGLAATQIGIFKSVVVVDLSERRNSLEVYINPSCSWSSEDQKISQEGCLSIPDWFDKVKRPAKVRVLYQNLQGLWKEEEFDGLRSVCLQHELDHLAGLLFIDRLSSLKRELGHKKTLKKKLLHGSISQT